MNSIKRIIALLIITGLAMSMSACAFSENQKDRLSAVAGKVTHIAIESIIQASINSKDRNKKESFLDDASNQLQHNLAYAITAEDVRHIIEAVTPDKSHWRDLAAKVADVYLQNTPTTEADRRRLIEAIAEGLKSASANGGASK